jgi:hypothetical protein
LETGQAQTGARDARVWLEGHAAEPELEKKAPKEQNAQDQQDCDNDDLDQAHFQFLTQ